MDRAVPALNVFPPSRFGHFALEPAQRRLLADGQPVSLGARAFDLLVILVARAGQLVSKHELLTLVWPGLVVEENNLQVQVSLLRKLLGPSALATIPGRGYRFELPVEAVVGDARLAKPASPAASLAPASTNTTEATATPMPERVATNVPPRSSTLYGRDPDLEAVKALLARHVVVTIAGAGGIGKTRVAQMVAAQLAVERAADFPDGVWWVELAPLMDGAHVVAAVARVLDTQLGPDRTPLATIAAVLAPQRALLVLDNCEHVMDAAASLVDTACAAAPGLRVLATSQETLKATDEHVYRLGALVVPAIDATEDVQRSGAVELFAARAGAVDPRFVLTAHNIQAVIEICRRLDGIPLAIELAAARVPLLGVEGLRARLDERFSVLTAGARAVLRRHQTLRATLEWSHALLTPDEQTVFRRLGIFAGSFTLEAAQHVARDTKIDGWAALDHLGALVDKSLVLAEGDPVPRYRLLETTRAYALERLGEAGETESTLRRHAEALLMCLLAIGRDVDLGRLKNSGWKDAGPEIDNLRAALGWVATADHCDELAISLAGNSLLVWSATAQLYEGLERSLALRRFLHAGLPASVAARFWLTIARLGLYTTRRDCYDAARQAAELYRPLGDARGLFKSLISCAVQGVRFGTVEEMGEAVEEAERLLRPDWPVAERASLEFARGRWLIRQGRFEEGLAAAQRQAAICEDGSSELGVHYAMSNVVAAENLLGRYEAALAHARSSIARLDAIGGGAGAGHLWVGVMNSEALLRRTDAAIAAGRTAYALLLCEGDELRVFPGLALCAALQGRLEDAARIIGYAEGVLARAGTVENSVWSAASERLRLALDAGLRADDLARLRAEGSQMREEVAVRLAFGDSV